MKLEFLAEARDELSEAALFYEARQAGLGQRFRDEIAHVCAAIKRDPLLWRERLGGYCRLFLTDAGSRPLSEFPSVKIRSSPPSVSQLSLVRSSFGGGGTISYQLPLSVRAPPRRRSSHQVHDGPRRPPSSVSQLSPLNSQLSPPAPPSVRDPKNLRKSAKSVDKSFPLNFSHRKHSGPSRKRAGFQPRHSPG